MAYITGSITDANPGPALHALMAPALTTAGFTLVDTVVISTRTHKVWKSPAAANAQNLDWYLDIGYTTTGAGTISLIAFEMFDPATDLGYRGPISSGGGTTIDAATGSRYGAAGFALEAAQWFNASMVGSQIAVSTTPFTYWISITTDRVFLLSSGSSELVLYAGFYEADPLYAAKAASLLFPLYTGRALMGTVYNGTLNTAGITRIPPLTAFFGASGWATSMQGVLPGQNTWPMMPSGPATAYPIPAFRVQLMSMPSISPENRIGRFGWLRDCYGIPSIGVVRGDTCTIEGVPHVLSTTGSVTPIYSYSLAFKAV
jgi:hypothetical protein